jgi:ribosome-binding protein aMBF1 (putative translation factor)
LVREIRAHVGGLATVARITFHSNAKPALVPVQLKQTSPAPKQAPPAPKKVTATAPSQLGAAILAARTAAGLSQTELATRLKTLQPNIARLENSGSIPSTTTLQRIGKATGHKLTISFSRDAELRKG